MADYFSDYSSYVSSKGLPSPADTPYDTPGFIRSKRTSREMSSREPSTTPPPLPPDTIDVPDKSRDGRYSNMDPRRFTPTLHASLVSEILSLRREIDSKNSLVENLESSLSQSKDENDVLAEKLAETTKEVRKAKQQIQQMEKGTNDAVEGLVRERDTAKSAFHELRNKFEVTQKKTRLQDNDAIRAQTIWESEKESWDNERRQLERRVHVTESRLRAVLDEMATLQSTTQPLRFDEYPGDESAFKDSGMGDGIGSDTTSIRTASPVKRRRSARKHISVSSKGTAVNGVSLADELDIDEEDEFDAEDSDNEEDGLPYTGAAKRTSHTSQHSIIRNHGTKTKSPTEWQEMLTEINARSTPARVLQVSTGTATDDLQLPTTPIALVQPMPMPVVYVDSGVQYTEDLPHPPRQPQNLPQAAYAVDGMVVKVDAKGVYVDNGFQPSPPSSPLSAVRVLRRSVIEEFAPDTQARPTDLRFDPVMQIRVATSPISPPETPEMDGATWSQDNLTTKVAPVYCTTSTQTDFVQPEKQTSRTLPQRDNLSPSMFVPSISIHPPSSRPSSPRPHVLPPGTKNAASQANLGIRYKDVWVQTETIRVDERVVKLGAHLLPSSNAMPPFTNIPLHEERRWDHAYSGGTASIFTKSPDGNPLHAPFELEADMPRATMSRDLRSYPLKALPLPRPVLAPARDETSVNGAPHRTLEYGVNQFKLIHSFPAEESSTPQNGNYDNNEILGMGRRPLGRFALSDPPKAVPEDKEISPDRRPSSAESFNGAAPAPSVTGSRPSSRAARHTMHTLPAKAEAKGDVFHARSTSAGSVPSSSTSAPTSLPLPPYPIPTRSSSRVIGNAQSEGSGSPRSSHFYHEDRGTRSYRSANHSRQQSLRKVQSAVAMRNKPSKSSNSSPRRVARRRPRSPDLTPINSMVFESPFVSKDFAAVPTDFPIPDLPIPQKSSVLTDNGSVVESSASTAPRISEENNLVDAIAGTMVGEWMWKYIRKRKSLIVGDDTAEIAAAAEQNGFMNGTGHGTRHKRWVWLSPYERTIMWDNKQPSNGTALLGRRGRKLPIQSVLEVPDTSSLPKNSELPTAWHKSILILTPERALKFTATTEERHGLWMTALIFLARSQAQSIQRLPRLPPFRSPPPPIPTNSNSIDGVQIGRHRSPSFGRAALRDSVRLAKGKRPDLSNLPHHPSNNLSTSTITTKVDDIDSRDNSADFPSIPRLYVTTSRHQRKRSNTNPSSLANIHSLTSTTSAHRYPSGSSLRPSLSSKSGSRRESNVTSPDRPNFFEAVGTLRMEAFVDPNMRDGVRYVPNAPGMLGSGPRKSRQSRNLSQSTVEKRRAGFVFDDSGNDPFSGF